MAEWDGTRLREVFESNVPGLLDVMMQMHSDQPKEVQMLVERIRDLVLASQNPRDSNDLRAPLIALINTMAAHTPLFLIDPYRHQLFLTARVFATVAMQVVDLREPAPVAPNAAAFEGLMSNFKFPDGSAPLPIAQQPTAVLAANEEQKPPARMSAKRKLVFKKEEAPPTSSPKRPLKIPKQEVESPVVAAAVQKRRSSRKSGVAVLDESAADSTLSLSLPVQIKVEPITDDEVEEVVEEQEEDIEKKKCDHCDQEVAVSETEQLKHAWKKHKDQVYKYIRPELVCTLPYCDYVSTSVNVRKIHVGRYHGIKTQAQRRVVSELKGAAKCPYCSADIESIAGLKTHSLQCTERDERPMLGCSFCPKQQFHFIYDFAAHLKKFGGVTHGKPVLLQYN